MADDLGDEWWNNKYNRSDLQSGERSLKKRKKSRHVVKETDDALVKPREADKGTESVEREEPRPKKKKKRRTKAEDLARGKHAVDPIEDFFNTFTEYQDKMTVIEKESYLDMKLLPLFHVPVVNDDFVTLFHGPLAKLATFFSKKSKLPGHPFVLIVTSSGVRAMDLKRKINGFYADTKIAKLFAKHLKIAAQVEELHTDYTQVGIGTPKRIQDLIEMDALKLSKLKYIILDWTWRDIKLRKMIDFMEIRKDLVSVLAKYLVPCCIEKCVQMVLV